MLTIQEKIIEKDGKFYVQQTNLVRETSLEALQGRLSEIREHKKTVLAQKATEYDLMSAEVTKQIQEIRKLREKRAKAPEKPPKKRQRTGQGGGPH